MAQLQVAVQAPSNTSVSDGLQPVMLGGKQAEGVVTELHGKYYVANYRGNVFTYNATAKTIPAIAATLASLFSLYNPPGSGKNLELIRLDYGVVLSTTVVDVLGLYYSTAALTAAGTFTTAGTALSGLIGNTATNVGIPYSAYTHSGTPVRHTIVGTFGAVTTTNDAPLFYDFDGRTIVPPGVIVSLALSTTAWTGSGMDLGLTWAEWPI